MAPPSYSDLGKDARGIFSKGYHFGLWQLDCKTRTKSGIEFKTSGHSNQDKQKVFGSLETKCNVKEYGLTLTEKWSTDNVLSTEVSVQDKILEGLKLAISGQIGIQSGNKSAKLTAGYTHDSVKIDIDTNVDSEGPIIKAATVFGYQGWLCGYHTGYDPQNSKITTNNFALGYASPEFVLHTNVNDGQDFTGSVFHKVNKQLDCGVQLAWSSKSSATNFGIGAKYQVDEDSCFRAKVNNASQVGLGYQQKLHDGVVLYLSTLIDAQNFNGGAHKIGAALELEA